MPNPDFSYVAGIDPGGTTGIAIVQVLLEPKAVTITPIYLDSLDDPRDVIHSIKLGRFPPSTIYMEQRASNPSTQEGLRAYELIRAKLLDIGYEIVSRNSTHQHSHCLHLISPGLWKPFMASRPVGLSSDWTFNTQHEKDALALLSYGLHTKYSNRRVYYA